MVYLLKNCLHNFLGSDFLKFDRDFILEEFKNDLLRNDKSNNTIITYVKNVKVFLDWIFDKYGENNPVGITKIDVESYQDFLLNVKKYKASGIKQRMYSVFSYCDFLYSKGYLEINPREGLKVLKAQSNRTSPVILSKNQLNQFRREVYKSQNIRDIAIVETFINTGIRVSELVDMEESDIILSERKGILVIREGKGKKYREIPLNKQVRKAIFEYLESRPSCESNKVFLGERGPITRDAVNKMLKKYASRIGLENFIYPHAFRHYLAHHLLRVKKLDPVLVSEILGHSDVNTLKIYTLPSFDEKVDALENIY